VNPPNDGPRRPDHEAAAIRFDDRVVVVTGGGRGIGRDNAIQFAARGARVVVNDNGVAADGYGAGDPAPANEVAATIRSSGGEAIADTNDVSDEAGAAALIERAINEYGKVDVVVNNAGIACIHPADIEGTTLDTFRHYQRFNLESSFLVTRQAWPHLAASGHGRVIFATSTAGYFGFPGQLSYNSSKLGMVGLIRSLAVEGAPVGILVNGVAPSAYTRLTEEVAARSPNPVMQEWLRNALPIELVTPMVLWLGSDECSVTGYDYDVAGGRISRLLITAETAGVVARALTPEAVREQLAAIHDQGEIVVIKQGRNHLGMLRNVLAQAD